MEIKLGLPEIATDLLNERELFVVYSDEHKQVLSSFLALMEPIGFRFHVIEDSKTFEDYIKRYLHKIALVVLDPRNPILETLKREEELSEMISDLLVLPVEVAAKSTVKSLDQLFSSEPAQIWFEKLREEFDLRNTFIHHTASLVDELEGLSLEIEKQPNSRAIINQLFNLVHTFKGASGFVRPKTLFEFTLHFEDLIKKVQNGENKINAGIVTLFLESIDMIKALRLNIENDLFHVVVLEKVLSFFDRRAVDVGATKASEDRSDQSGSAADILGNQDLTFKKNTEIKIGLELLDRMLETTGEMTVIRNMLNKIIRSVERRYGQDKEVLLLSELLNELHKTNESIQQQMTNLREIPVKDILKPLQRVVRDTANYCKKNVRLETTGQDLRIDTTIADILNQTLIHLVRNSVDHGLETPAQREEAGKASQGEVKISVRINRDVVRVEISDDGKGIDPAKIRNKVIEKGLVKADELTELSDQEIIQYIFSPGFSTAEEVTDISGRGVGMGAVKASVESIGGTLVIQSEVGFGTNTTLLLPIPKTARIIDCLFVNCMGRGFGIPQEWIQRVVRVHEGNRSDLIRYIGGGHVFASELGIMPIVELNETLFGETKLINSNIDYDVLIIKTTTHRPYALAVESVLDVEDAVVKKIDPLDRQLKVFSGATFVADGTVGLIVDLEGVAEKNALQLKKRKLELDQATFTASKSNFGNRFIVFSVANIDEVNVNQIAFEGAHQKRFAVRERDVFRVEQITKTMLQQVAGAARIPYRDTCLHLIDLRRFGTGMNLMDHQSIQESDACYCIVTKHNKTHYVGLLIEKIYDIFESNSEVIQSAIPVNGIEGTFIHEDNIHTLINLSELVEAQLNNQAAERDLVVSF